MQPNIWLSLAFLSMPELTIEEYLPAPSYTITQQKKLTNLFQSHIAGDNLVNLILWIQKMCCVTHIEISIVWQQWILWQVIYCELRPHHTDELNELKTHSNVHFVLEMTDRTDNLIVTSEKGFK